MVKKRDAVSPAITGLHRDVRAVLDEARASAYRAVNTAMVQSYWEVGRLIVKHEQGGAKRAAYGEQVLAELSRRLTAEFGRGFDATNLRNMRQFHVLFEIRDAVRRELSWTHYRLLMRVENGTAREWYMNEAANQHWSTRQLDRQISVLYHERLLASRNKPSVRKEARVKLAAVAPERGDRQVFSAERRSADLRRQIRQGAAERTGPCGLGRA